MPASVNSRSTLWRRAGDGSIVRGDKPSARGRATLVWDDVLGLMWASEGGDAEAQAALLYVAGAGKSGEQRAQDDHLAIMWIAKAAASGYSIAQQQMVGLMPGGRCPGG